VPAIVLYGADDFLARGSAQITAADRASFPKLIAKRVVPGGGHFLPHEKPEVVSAALIEVLAASK
jgi:pimeloyl-ACP methyl ester carboxylesterase